MDHVTACKGELEMPAMIACSAELLNSYSLAKAAPSTYSLVSVGVQGPMDGGGDTQSWGPMEVEYSGKRLFTLCLDNSSGLCEKASGTMCFFPGMCTG